MAVIHYSTDLVVRVALHVVHERSNEGSERPKPGAPVTIGKKQGTVTRTHTRTQDTWRKKRQCTLIKTATPFAVKERCDSETSANTPPTSVTS